MVSRPAALCYTQVVLRKTRASVNEGVRGRIGGPRQSGDSALARVDKVAQLLIFYWKTMANWAVLHSVRNDYPYWSTLFVLVCYLFLILYKL